MFSEDQGVQTFFRWAFYILIAVFPFILYGGYLFSGTSSRAVNTILFVELLAVVFGGALLFQKQRLSAILSPVTGALALLLIVLFVSSSVGADFHTSFWSKATRTTGLFYFIHLAFLYLFFWFAFDQQKSLRTFLKVFSISAGLFSILAALGQEGVGWFFATKSWAGLTIGNSTFAGMYLYAGFMIAAYLVATATNKRWWNYLLPFILVCNPYLLNFDVFRGSATNIIGSAQASAITLYVSVLTLCMLWGGSKIRQVSVRRTLLILGTIVAVVVLMIGIRSLLTPGGKVQQLYMTQASATRPIVWQFSKEAIAARPVFGWGVDNFDIVFQKYYDPSILELKNGGEAWLDRAHNIVIDQTVESGYVGMAVYILVYAVLIGSLLYVLIRSTVRDDKVLAAVLLVYFVGHLLELQTAFDTTVTYVPLVCFAAITGTVFYRTRKVVTSKNQCIAIPTFLQQGVGVVMIVGAVILFFAGTVPIMAAESANGAIRRVGSSEKRMEMYKTLFSSPLDTGAFLWQTSNDIQRGVSLDPKMIENPKQREALKNELGVIVDAYEEYLTRYPDDYRAILNLADIYIYQRLFEVDNLTKAQRVLDHAVTLVPQSPQPYWMQAVSYLYQAKFKEAKMWAQRAYDLNPGIEESTRLKEYITTASKEFPVIDLYSFKQI